MKCPECDGPARYSLFSGGREAHCEDFDGCRSEGPIEDFLTSDDLEPRAMLLRTAEGRLELSTQMHDHLAEGFRVR